MDPAVLNLAQFLADIGALAAVILGGLGIYREVRRSRVERELGRLEREQASALRAEDLRWRRASAARGLLTDIHNNDRATRAVEILDWCEGGHSQRLPSGATATITAATVRDALGQQRPQDDLDVYIVDCFDWFLYYLDRMEHYLGNGLILFEDVASTMAPYARALRNQRLPIEVLTAQRSYDGVERLLSRFPKPDGAVARPS